MATEEMRRPSQQAAAPAPAQAAPAADLDDRLNSLLGGAPDEADLPPMDLPRTEAPASAVFHDAVEEPVAAPAPAVVAPAPAVVAEAVPEPAAPQAEVAPPAQVATEAPPAAAPAAPTTLVPRPLINLTPPEKRDASLQAELYSILVTMEHLEGAFVKGVVSNEDYERHCKQIVTQFKTLETALRQKVPDIKAWIREQEMSCPLAEERLLGTGIAATALHTAATTSTGGKEARTIHSATEHFITLTNALQINYNSCLELLPLIQELQTSIVNIPNLPQLAGMERITNWLVTLNNMRASDTLNEQQIQQLTLDADLAYTSFRNWLQQM